MARRISELAAASSANAADDLPANQSGTTRRVTPAQIIALAWPVGSVFIAVVATNPNTLLGFGTWAAFGTGRTLVGIDAADADFDVVEEVGGAKTVTLVTAEIPAHTHVQDAHTHVQNSHSHLQRSQTATTGTASSWEHGVLDTTSTAAETLATDTTVATNQNTTATNQNAGGGGAHANVQPYIVVYMWKRTA